MPELPEIEVVLKELQRHLIGKKILYVIVRCSKLRWPISKEIYELKNQIIIKVKRRAKYLIIKLLNNGYILIHLGMSGSLRFFKITKSTLVFNKHDHIDLVFKNKLLRYHDPRKFGCWLWEPDLKNHKLLKKLGPEPFSKEFNYKYLFNKSRSIKKSIKPWIMESKIVSGIGNIYANEILFAAKIFPDRTAMSLTKEECLTLVKKVKIILLQAINQGGTTLRNFIKTDGSIGLFNKELQIYNKKGKKCLYCSLPIKTMIHSKRTTFFCTYCQK